MGDPLAAGCNGFSTAGCSRLAFRFLVKPLIWTALVWCVTPGGRGDTGNALGTGWPRSFWLVNLLLNSRLGRNAEEVIVDWLVQAWHRFGSAPDCRPVLVDR